MEIASGVLSVLGRSIDTVQRVFQRRCELLSTGKKTWYSRCFKAGDDMSLGKTTAAKSERERERDRERERERERERIYEHCRVSFGNFRCSFKGKSLPGLDCPVTVHSKHVLETCFRLYSNCCEKFLRPARCLGFRV